jgi:hypothetical protein
MTLVDALADCYSIGDPDAERIASASIYPVRFTCRMEKIILMDVCDVKFR